MDSNHSTPNLLQGFSQLLPILYQGKLGDMTRALDVFCNSRGMSREEGAAFLDGIEKKARGVTDLAPLFDEVAPLFDGDRQLAAQAVLLLCVRGAALQQYGKLVAADVAANVLRSEAIDNVISPAQFQSRRAIKKTENTFEQTLMTFGGLGEAQASQTVRLFEAKAHEIIAAQFGFPAPTGKESAR